MISYHGISDYTLIKDRRLPETIVLDVHFGPTNKHARMT